MQNELTKHVWQRTREAGSRVHLEGGAEGYTPEMGQTLSSSRQGYEAVPDVETVPLSAANLEARDQHSRRVVRVFAPTTRLQP